MKRFLLRTLLILLPLLYSIYSWSQPGKGSKDCSTTCFTSEVISKEPLSETCTAWELRVSVNGPCAHALSHYTVEVPCGEISELWNSEGWAQEIGTDPTSGLTGFKIDDISDFGEKGPSAFTVRFVHCSTEEQCGNDCWQPRVAYKAATCVNFETLAVNCGPTLDASLAHTDVSCNGAGDGTLEVIINNGKEPFTFQWSDGSTEQTRTNLSAGTYSVVVADGAGETLTLEATIAEPVAITISGDALAASCAGVANGKIDVTANGGNGALSFLWSNGATTEDLEHLEPGLYGVTVTDESGCSATKTFTVGQSGSMTITGDVIAPDCSTANGAIDITVSGGTAPYSFAWTNQQDTEDLSGISAGIHTVVVTDASGCTASRSFLLRENNTLTVKGVVSATNCIDDAAGGVDVTVTGGTAPYTYIWSDGQETEDASGLAAGSYTLTVSDAAGCQTTASFTVARKTFDVSRNITQPSCNGTTDGSIVINDPVGGTAPYSYEWSNGATGPVLTDLGPGLYTVTVRDASGCEKSVSSLITDPAPIQASAVVTYNGCGEGAIAEVDLNVSGGTAPYTYEWSNGTTDQDVSSLPDGVHTVVITDSRGCSITETIVVERPESDLPCGIEDPSDPPVCGSEGNTLVATVSDADTYSWSVESSDGSWVIVSENGSMITYNAGNANTSATFTVTVEKDGCTQTCSYTITTCTPDEDPDGEEPGNPDDGEDPGNPGDGEDPGDPGDDEDPGNPDDGEDPGNPDDGEDPGNPDDGEDPGNPDDGEDPGNPDDGEQPGDNDGDCGSCFETIATLTNSSGACRTYEMVISTDGTCRYDLSHWTVAIPCGRISDVWNSENWAVEIGKDPTTGLTGLKIDDIDGFGKSPASFTVRFTVCEEGSCDLSSWEPRVAYKAGQCVDIEPVSLSQTTAQAITVSAFPNPVSDVVNIVWSGSYQAASLQIVDQYGNLIQQWSGTSRNHGESAIKIESSHLPRGMYYYRLTIDGETYTGKLTKR